MGQKYRLIMLGLSLIVLLAIGWNATGSFNFLCNDFWFTSGMLLLLLLSLIDQPFFSKDSNIFVNATTAALSLLLVPVNERDKVFWIFTGVILYLTISSYILMWVRKIRLLEEKKIVQMAAKINREIGKPEVIFSSFFLWGGIKQFGTQSAVFNDLLLFWMFFILLNIPSLAKAIEGVFVNGKNITRNNAIGEIFGVQSKNTFLVKLLSDRKTSATVFDFVEFEYSIDKKKRKGLIVDVYLLNQEQWIKVLCTPEITDICGNEFENCNPDIVYKLDIGKDTDFLNRFIGIVAENSTIRKIKFIYNSKREVNEGQLVELKIGNKKVLYQIVQGVTKIENLEQKNESSYIEGEAIQLGCWDETKESFEQFGWVPEINTPIFFASKISDPKISGNEYVVGYIPNTNYPAILDKNAAVTHHTAILGVTGCGKSVFARKLIQEITDTNTKAIIVDLTGEYQDKIKGINKIISETLAKDIFNHVEELAKEKSKFPNQQNKNIIDEKQKDIKEMFYSSIKNFLEGDEKQAIFEIPDISNNADILEYTKWFFWVLFQTAKTKKNFGKRVCVVLEEAHTVVPEINSMGVSDFASKATVNSIAQIALQGRKYNIGFVVIAQRTANVSKTVLTQCNTIIAFQSLDRTSGDFLSNYLGKELIDTLPSLKFRTAIAVGKAFRSTTPMIFEIPDINEEIDCADQESN
ncbi:ATP-binding protein [Phascolarctobacterium sp.]